MAGPRLKKDSVLPAREFIPCKALSFLNDSSIKAIVLKSPLSLNDSCFSVFQSCFLSKLIGNLASIYCYFTTVVLSSPKLKQFTKLIIMKNLTLFLLTKTTKPLIKGVTILTENVLFSSFFYGP